MVPVEWEDSTVLTGESQSVRGVGGLHYHLHCRYNIELQVVLSTPGHQMVPLNFVYMFEDTLLQTGAPISG